MEKLTKLIRQVMRLKIEKGSLSNEEYQREINARTKVAINSYMRLTPKERDEFKEAAKRFVGSHQTSWK